MPKYFTVTLLLLCFVRPTAVQGQARPIITDRPDFTESPFAVPLGSIQLETGLMIETDQGMTFVSGPEALLRWSPAEGLEIRLGPPGYIGGDASEGYTDMSLGAKVELGTFTAWTFGAIGSVGLPTGSDETSAGGAEPGLILAAGRDVAEAWSVGMQASVARLSEADGTGIGSTLVVGRSLTPTIGSFLEIAIDRESASTLAVLHGGFAVSLSPTLQLDLHAVAGLTDNTPSRAVGIGFSTRFDRR